MSGEFWMAMALHPTSCGHNGGGGATNGANGPKSILKHGGGGAGGGFGDGGGGLKRKHSSNQQGTNGACTSTAAAPQAPLPLSPRAKAYRKWVLCLALVTLQSLKAAIARSERLAMIHALPSGHLPIC